MSRGLAVCHCKDSTQLRSLPLASRSTQSQQPVLLAYQLRRCHSSSPRSTRKRRRATLVRTSFGELKGPQRPGAVAPGSHTVPGQPSQGILPGRVEGVVAWGPPGIAPARGVRAGIQFGGLGHDPTFYPFALDDC